MWLNFFRVQKRRQCDPKTKMWPKDEEPAPQHLLQLFWKRGMQGSLGLHACTFIPYFLSSLMCFVGRCPDFPRLRTSDAFDKGAWDVCSCKTCREWARCNSTKTLQFLKTGVKSNQKVGEQVVMIMFQETTLHQDNGMHLLASFAMEMGHTIKWVVQGNQMMLLIAVQRTWIGPIVSRLTLGLC